MSEIEAAQDIADTATSAAGAPLVAASEPANNEKESTSKRKEMEDEEQAQNMDTIDSSKRLKTDDILAPVTPFYLLVQNLTRPFTVDSLKALLATDGQQVGTFWMNSIRSHCVVSFLDEPTTVACMKRIHGLQWPLRTGKTLAVEQIPEHRAADIMAPKGRNSSIPAPRYTAPKLASSVSMSSTSSSTVTEAEAGRTVVASSTSTTVQTAETPAEVVVPMAASVPVQTATSKRAPRGMANLFARASKAAIESTCNVIIRKEPAMETNIYPDSRPLEGAAEAVDAAEVASKVNIDLLFRKTLCKPVLYYKPLLEEEVALRKKEIAATAQTQVAVSVDE